MAVVFPERDRDGCANGRVGEVNGSVGYTCPQVYYRQQQHYDYSK